MTAEATKVKALLAALERMRIERPAAFARLVKLGRQQETK